MEGMTVQISYQLDHQITGIFFAYLSDYLLSSTSLSPLCPLPVLSSSCIWGGKCSMTGSCALGVLVSLIWYAIWWCSTCTTPLQLRPYVKFGNNGSSQQHPMSLSKNHFWRGPRELAKYCKLGNLCSILMPCPHCSHSYLRVMNSLASKVIM
jgi:hypothetical protein